MVPSRAYFRRCVLLVLAAVVSMPMGCATDVRRGGDCALRKGMSAETLIRCGCVQARSGGGSVVVDGYGGGSGRTITIVHYICSRGEGRLDRVEVVNGVVVSKLY
jgi:hypothetical protein